MNRDLILIPISEEKNDDNTFLISINDVSYLSFLATTLEPVDAWEEIDGYTGALFEYMHEIKSKEQELYKKYDKLIHASNGFNLLKCTIQLMFLEKKMRENGIDQELINSYNHLQGEYLYYIQDLQTK